MTTTKHWARYPKKTNILDLKDRAFKAATFPNHVSVNEKVQPVAPADLEEGQSTNIPLKQFIWGIDIQDGGSRPWVVVTSFSLHDPLGPDPSALAAKQMNDSSLQRTTEVFHLRFSCSSSLRGMDLYFG